MNRARRKLLGSLSQFSLLGVALSLGITGCNGADFSGNSGSKKKASGAYEGAGVPTSEVPNSHSENSSTPGSPNNSALQPGSSPSAGQVTYTDQTQGMPESRVVTEDGIAKEVKEKFSSQPVAATLADIIFVMDSSSSMNEEKASLEAQMSRFLSRLGGADSKFDYRVFVLGTGFSFSDVGDRSRLQTVPWSVGSHDGLAVLQKFLSSGSSSGLALREKASKEIVMITDEEAGIAEARSFSSFAANLRSTLHFHGFVGLPNSRQTSSCQILGAGRTYMNLSRTYPGLIQDICSENWQRLLDNLAASIVHSRRVSRYILAFPADSNSPIEVKVSGRVVPSSNYRYQNAEEPFILFSDEVAPLADQEVEIMYTKAR